MGDRAGAQLRLSVVVFLTLQHRVVVAGALGPLHSHSCSVEVEVAPAAGSTIPFAEVEAELKAQITPFDGKTLNELGNFRGINPTVENLAAHLFNRLSLISAEYGAILHSVTIRESPTRAVKYVRSEEGVSLQTRPDNADSFDEALEAGTAGVQDPVILRPIAFPRDYISTVRNLRAPISSIPESPNQMPHDQFDPEAGVSQTLHRETTSRPVDGLPSRGKLTESQMALLGRAVSPGLKETELGGTERQETTEDESGPRDDGGQRLAANQPEALRGSPETRYGVQTKRDQAKAPVRGLDNQPDSVDELDEFDIENLPGEPEAGQSPHFEDKRAQRVGGYPPAGKPDLRAAAPLSGLPSRKNRKKMASGKKAPNVGEDQPGRGLKRASAASRGGDRSRHGDAHDPGSGTVSKREDVASRQARESGRSWKASLAVDEAFSREISHRRPVLHVVLAIIFLIACAVLVYRNLIWPSPGQGYPWGSDTWGHIKKAEFLLSEITKGNWLPSFSPMWYNGIEPFRYWAPLPYYLLAGLTYFSESSFAAAGIYVALCALIGSLGWLLFKNRIGLIPATMAGLCWMVWQDNVRVAMSEGNLPRVLAAALLPYLLSAFVLVCEKPGEKWLSRTIGLAGLAFVTILTHAMIAATFFLTLTLLGACWALWMGIQLRDLVRGVAGIFAGIGLSAWWLVPSLQNGIAAINSEAVSEAMQYFPLTVSMNPRLRLSQPEIFYWGISVAIVMLVSIITWKMQSRLSRGALVASVLLVAITTPALKPLYSSIPGSYLIFPLYMATGASGLIILVATGLVDKKGESKRESVFRILTVVLLSITLLGDSYVSLFMINTRPEPNWMVDISADFPDGGWREATLDTSRFGSAASYILAGDGKREQVFGWAWQGATTAPNIVDLNSALLDKNYEFLVDRLIELGATHLVAWREILDEESFLAAVGQRGYREVSRTSEALLLVRDVGPYVVAADYRGLVIGRSGPNWTKMFPALELGGSTIIDGYSYESLEPYDVLVVSGAKWADRTKAEELVARFAGSGRTVLIDLQDLPADVLSKRPTFLGVSGEPIMLYKSPTLITGTYPDETAVGTLFPFAEEYYPWKALSPQGVDDIVIHFPYLGENVTVAGYKRLPKGGVWFVGSNIPFHAYLTKDPVALDVLSEIIHIKPGQVPDRNIIEVQGYEASAQGYSFTVDIPESLNGRCITIPVASRDNLIVSVDGVPVQHSSVHNLVKLQITSGRHSIKIEPTHPRVLVIGEGISIAVLTLLVVTYFVQVASKLRATRRGQVGVLHGVEG